MGAYAVSCRTRRSFRSLPHARAVLEASQQDYNAERPHSPLGYLVFYQSKGQSWRA